jgi:hypothetical protein
VIRLKPITTEQTFSVVPSSYSTADILECLIYITDEETNITQSYLPVADLEWEFVDYNWEETNFNWEFDESTATEGWRFALSSNGNYLNITILSTTELKESSRYRIEIKNETLVLFRDTIFVTSETDKKKVYSYPDVYKKYDDGEDTYIVL